MHKTIFGGKFLFWITNHHKAHNVKFLYIKNTSDFFFGFAIRCSQIQAFSFGHPRLHDAALIVNANMTLDGSDAIFRAGAADGGAYSCGSGGMRGTSPAGYSQDHAEQQRQSPLLLHQL